MQAASDGFQQVLKRFPRHAPSLHRLGTIALRLGQVEAAANLIEAAIAIDDNVAAFHNDLGETYRALGLTGDAIGELVRAIDLDPRLGGTLNNLAMILQEAGKLDDAIPLYRQAASLNPEIATIHMNLGCALLETGATDVAATAMEQAHHLAPKDPTVLLNLGNVRMAQDRPDAAIPYYKAAANIQPDHALAALNLGRAYRDLGQAQTALSYYDRAATLQPDLPLAHWNGALCSLLLGDFARGWRDFATRWDAKAVPPHGLGTPEWDGSPLQGQTLLVHAEQGLGDTLQFIRFMPLLNAAGAARIVFLCQKPLQRLLSAFWSDLVTDPADLPHCDCRIPLLDLPRLFNIDAGKLSANPPPYLTASPEIVTRWRERLGTPAKPRIGIVWQGRPEHANDRNRSIPLGRLQPLFNIDAVDWFSLQKGLTGAPPAPLTDLAADLTDMAETAAAIQCLDLVIAVDTSVAHLAGALGKPVWVLLPFAPDWRWMEARDDSPWYPKAQLFRQETAGDWDGVVQRVADAFIPFAISAGAD